MTTSSSIMSSKRIRIVLALFLALTALTNFFPRRALAADGDLDATFGTGDASVPAGVARVFFGADSLAANDVAYALGIQSQTTNAGKIVIGGVKQTTPPFNADFALARLNTNGTLDTSFGSSGKVTTDVTNSDTLNDMAVDSLDDTIVAVGTATGSVPCTNTNIDWMIAKYTANGALDTSFNTTGIVQKDFFGCGDQATAVVIQPDHKIVVVGTAAQVVGMTLTFFLALARLNTNGSFDSTFNGGDGMNTSGIVKYDIAASSLFFPTDMARIPSGGDAGKFIVAGNFSGASADFAVARFNTDGSLDTTFGTAGKTTTDINSGSNDNCKSLALQSDGKILLGGDINNADFAMARYNSNGSLDTMFGVGGKVVTDFGVPSDPISNDAGQSVSQMSNGKIIFSGFVGRINSSTDNIGIARYNSDGTLDSTFGPDGNGKVVTHLGQNPNGNGPGSPLDNVLLARAGALQSDGKILVAGGINTAGKLDEDFFVARFSNGLDCAITCPANKTQSNDSNQCGAVVTFASPSETGTQCGGIVTCSPASGSFFPVGTTTVACSDSAGPTCSFTVTVNDTQNPTITCPSNITTPGTTCQTVTYTTPTPSDNCPGPTASCAPPSGTCFAVGTTTVTCTAKDASNNMATCTFTVTVSDCAITCPANITRSNDPNQCGAAITYPAPGTTGTCGTVSCSPASGSFFAKGTTTVACSTTAGPSCSFTVTVNDTQPPTITCPANKTAKTATINDPCVVVTFAPIASDNCPGVTAGCNPPSGSCFPVGTSTVTCTATDTSGNTATCSFTVSVFNACLQDDSNPNIVFLGNSVTGAYRFCCNGTTFTGVALVTRRGNVVSFQHNAPDRRVQATDDESVFKGSASLQSPPGTIRCTITDRDTRNNSCICQ
jgi:uncharacterized delta-60 repeat protein